MVFHKLCKAVIYKSQAVRFAQQKLDGHRLTITCTSEGIRAFSRKGDITDKVKDYSWFPKSLPPTSSFDGELWFPDTPASSIKTRLNNHKQLLFWVFAMPFYNGNGFMYSDLSDIQTIVVDAGFVFIPWEPVIISSSLKYWYAMARKRKCEGWVFKNYNYVDWYKVKETQTVDCVVTGIKSGQGKYHGMCGALLVSVWIDGRITEIASISGFTDDERALISSKDIGRVVEVEYQDVAAKGRLRFPRFVRWRDDKPAEECTLANTRRLS